MSQRGQAGTISRSQHGETAGARQGQPGASGQGGAHRARPGWLSLSYWRRWRGVAAVAAVVLIGAVAIALLQQGPPVAGPLDPNGVTSPGTHALAALLTQRGQTVVRVTTVSQAVAQARRTGTTLVLAGPQSLDAGQLAALSQVSANLLLVAPDEADLAALAPHDTTAGVTDIRASAPACGLPAARAAGSADMGGTLFSSDAPGAWRCYPAFPVLDADGQPGEGFASLVTYTSAGRVVTALGTGLPLTNGALGQQGDAALALNLLGGTQRVVWLVPTPPVRPAVATGPRPLSALIPQSAHLVVVELSVAVLLIALWRARRFGPLIAEPIPVTVRSAETVVGHGRLYRTRRARDRVAATLRAAALARITARLGQPPDVQPEVVCHELANRTGRDTEQVRQILFGAVPADDAALLRLANDLDSLEGQVLSP
ncbi:MAG TPA: DUF4350 domain-containing protein [Streptosporangiaceae bacterium]|nr:DUF4350 domain-containing protein [Streptosporangiaceae bacterium]